MPQQTRSIALIPEKPIFGGYSLCRHEGKAILVPFAIPGEKVMVRIVEEKKDYSIGEIESIISPSGSRITPACPLYERCGGCCYLHVPYGHELDFKKAILRDVMSRTAGMDAADLPEIEMHSGNRFHYRSHAALKADSVGQGFYRKGTNDLIPLRETGCLLLADGLNGWLGCNPGISRDFRVAIDASGNVITSLDADPLVREMAGGLTFMRGIDRFFQANLFLRDKMIEIVRRYAVIGSSSTYLDIGCGVGFFTLSLAGSSREGVGIDINRESIRWARQNAAHNNIDNVRFQAMPAARIHPTRLCADLAVIDPPRAGIDRKTRQTLLAMGPESIIYVSCNPSTFARDAKDFVRGGYRLDNLTLIDMFPCTHHIEVVSRFAR